MFLDNKYTKTYFAIISAARQNPHIGYTENHHIIPASFGGNKNKENLVALSMRQHFICHLLLTRMCTGRNKQKMDKAIKFLITSPKKNAGRKTVKISSRWVEYARINGNKSSKGKPRPQSVKDAVSAANRGRTPWNKGKTMSSDFCAAISRVRTGKPAHNKGIPMLETQKVKLSETMSGRKLPIETREKMSIAKKGKPPNNKGRGKNQISSSSTAIAA